MTYPKNSGERRVLKDRRKFNYTAYAPERRSGIDRRIEQVQRTQMKVA